MPTPAVTLKLKKFRRRFGIAAPKVVIRSHLSWVWYLTGGALLLTLVFATVWLLLKSGEVQSLDRELESLRIQVREQGDELLLLRSTTGIEQNAVRMERSVQEKLLHRIKSLEAENAALKEDTLLFERLIPVPGEEALVRIENFRLLPDGDGRFRYRLLLAYQPGKQAADFRGRLQFLVGFVAAGKEQQLLLPGERDPASDYVLEIRHFLRREGVIELPLGGRLGQVEVRVLVGDTLKAKRVAQL